MSNPADLSTAFSGTPDTVGGVKVASLVSPGTAGEKIIGDVLLSDAIGNQPSQHRAPGTSDQPVVDMSTVGFGAAGQERILSRGAIVVWVDFDTPGASLTATPVFYDDANAPQGLGPQLTFVATTKRRAAAGSYMTAAQILDTYGFRRFKFYRDAVSPSTAQSVIFA
ncbi:MAG: hypothetical protein ACREKB_00555, partial [Candidatus Rokuibacteriota bacterium]